MTCYLPAVRPFARPTPSRVRMGEESETLDDRRIEHRRSPGRNARSGGSTDSRTSREVCGASCLPVIELSVGSCPTLGPCSELVDGLRCLWPMEIAKDLTPPPEVKSDSF